MRNKPNCSKNLHGPYGPACLLPCKSGPVQNDLQAMYGKDGIEQLYPMPSVSTQAYEKLSELPMLDDLVLRTWARNLNTPFDRLLLLQAGRVAKAYDSQQKVVKAMAILGMLKAALGRDWLLAEDRVEADTYLAKLGAEGI